MEFVGKTGSIDTAPPTEKFMLIMFGSLPTFFYFWCCLFIGKVFLWQKPSTLRPMESCRIKATARLQLSDFLIVTSQRMVFHESSVCQMVFMAIWHTFLFSYCFRSDLSLVHIRAPPNFELHVMKLKISEVYYDKEKR
ncbi:MAG: hypothetical protein SPJ30_10890 [Faecalibacterium sp.]|nr:hypothetical protein [Faecalibacterium sp.]